MIVGAIRRVVTLWVSWPAAGTYSRSSRANAWAYSRG